MTKGILGKSGNDTNLHWIWWINSSNCCRSYSKRSTTSETMETDGYEAIQVGYQDMREVLSNKPAKSVAKQTRLLSASFVNSKCWARRIWSRKEITVDVFQAGDIIDVTGTTKGKGFQGVIKRHGQSRGPMAHGSRYHRRPGSMGPVAPNRVFKTNVLLAVWVATA